MGNGANLRRCRDVGIELGGHALFAIACPNKIIADKNHFQFCKLIDDVILDANYQDYLFQPHGLVLRLNIATKNDYLNLLWKNMAKTEFGDGYTITAKLHNVDETWQRIPTLGSFLECALKSYDIHAKDELENKQLLEKGRIIGLTEPFAVFDATNLLTITAKVREVTKKADLIDNDLARIFDSGFDTLYVIKAKQKQSYLDAVLPPGTDDDAVTPRRF